MLEAEVQDALNRGGIIDITTTGRRSGKDHRIECLLYAIDGHYYISGRPDAKKRDWLQNLEAQPEFTLHLKRDVVADLPAIARPVVAAPERRELLQKIPSVGQEYDMEDRVAMSPLVEVTFP